MQDSMSFDTTPVCENCVQVPYQDGGVEARKEAVAFINQLKRQFGGALVIICFVILWMNVLYRWVG